MIIMNNVLLFVRSSHARVQTNLMIFEVFGSRSNITRSNDIGPSGDEVKKTNWLSIVISSCTVNRGFSISTIRYCGVITRIFITIEKFKVSEISEVNLYFVIMFGFGFQWRYIFTPVIHQDYN